MPRAWVVGKAAHRLGEGKRTPDHLRRRDRSRLDTYASRALASSFGVAALRHLIRERPLHEVAGEHRVGRRVEELRAGVAAVRAEGWGVGRARLLGRALTVTMPPSESVKNSSTFGPTPSSANTRESCEMQLHEFVVGKAQRTGRTHRLRPAHTSEEEVLLVARAQARGAADDLRRRGGTLSLGHRARHQLPGLKSVRGPASRFPRRGIACEVGEGRKVSVEAGARRGQGESSPVLRRALLARQGDHPRLHSRPSAAGGYERVSDLKQCGTVQNVAAAYS